MVDCFWSILSDEKMDKRGFILRCEMLIILFCVFSAFNIVLASPIADDSQTNPVGLSLPVETNRTRRSTIGSVASLISFTVTNIRKAFDEKRSVSKEVFQNFQDELKAQTGELQSISQNINMLGLSVAYAEHEKNIKDNLLALQQYLEHPSDHYRNVFIEQGKHLNQDINYLVDGLLGQNRFSPDIMAAIRDAAKCHGQKMRKNVEFIFSVIMTGLWVRGEYQRIIENTEGKRLRGEYQRIIENTEGKRYPSSLIFKKSITDSQKILTERLDYMLVKCQADEGNVSHEMRQILEATTPGQSAKSVAGSLLEFLENKYDTKRWIVVFLSNIKWQDIFYEPLHGTKTYGGSSWMASSKGFHKTTYKNDLAVAVSVDGEGDFSATRTLMDSHFKEFEIPLRQVPLKLGVDCLSPNGWHSISEHVREFWIPIHTTDRLDVELLSFEQNWVENTIAVTSKGAQYVRLPTSARCSQMLVLLIPRTPIVPKSACSYNPVRVQKSGQLSNPGGQGYLSVKDDSSKEGAYVILEQESRRSPGQTWTFVNNQLRNGFGKCLTAWKNRSWYLYQYDCHHNWPGQKWTRRGLQIINGYGYCLHGGSSNRYAIQHYCSDWWPNLWHNLDTAC